MFILCDTYYAMWAQCSHVHFGARALLAVSVVHQLARVVTCIYHVSVTWVCHAFITCCHAFITCLSRGFVTRLSRVCHVFVTCVCHVCLSRVCHVCLSPCAIMFLRIHDCYILSGRYQLHTGYDALKIITIISEGLWGSKVTTTIFSP